MNLPKIYRKNSNSFRGILYSLSLVLIFFYSVLGTNAIIVTGKIIELPDNVHIVLEDKNGKKYWIGHDLAFTSDNLGQNFAFYLIPRKNFRQILIRSINAMLS